MAAALPPETVSTLNHVLALMEASDRRYMALFEASNKAVEVAFAAQQGQITAALTASKELVNAALLANKEAVMKAEIAVEKRLEGLNEFRGQMADQQARFILKEQADTQFSAIEKRLGDIITRLARSEGKETGAFDLRSWIITLIMAGIAVVGFLRK